MDKKAEILRKLVQLGQQQPVLMPAEVISVNEENLTCVIEIDELQFNARLSAAEGSLKGFFIIPAEGSWVLAGRLDPNGDVWQVIGFTAVSKIVMRNGSNGGLINIEDLVSNINEREQRINAIVTSLTELAAACTLIGNIPLTGTSMATAITNAITDIITPIPITLRSEFEDDTILH